MREDESISIKCLTENFKFPVKLEWKKYVNDVIKPGEVILQVSDLSTGQVVTKVKSICHGKVVSCLTPKTCEVISVNEKLGTENGHQLAGFEFSTCQDGSDDTAGPGSGRSTLYIKQENPNSHNSRYCFGYYSCDHTTFLSDICVECGFVHQGKSGYDGHIKSGTIAESRHKVTGSKGAAPIHIVGQKSNYETGNGYKDKDGDERMLINAGFLSNNKYIKFDKSYVDKQEKSFIFELLYVKRKLSLVLDLDNTLIHASSSLPESKSREDFLEIKEILESELTEETFNRYQGSVVMLGNKPSINEILPAGLHALPHYSDEASLKEQLYFRLLESLVFCIPLGGSSSSGTRNHRTSSGWSFGYYKLRPGVINMLRTLSKDKYEIYMYTMGTEYHAYTSLRILDPELRFFSSSRIFYRNNGFKEASIKSLSTLFPYDHRTLVILDDIEQAWTDINSLLKVYPYNFFPSISIPNESGNFSRYISQIRANNRWSKLIKRKRFRSNQEDEDEDKGKDGSGHLEAKEASANNQSSADIIKEAIRTEKDQQLLVFQKLLVAIHEAYFAEFDLTLSTKAKLLQDEDSLVQTIYEEAPRTSNVIKIMRKGVLKDCVLQFTGFNNKFFYNFVDSDLYKWCRYFGSSLLDSSSENSLVTHCICEQLYTEKYHHAKENGIPCVNILWLESIIYTWISPHKINIYNPILSDPVNSDYYSPFDILNFADEESPDFVDLENYNYSHLYGLNTYESLQEKLWEEAFDDISFSLGEEDEEDNSVYPSNSPTDSL